MFGLWEKRKAAGMVLRQEEYGTGRRTAVPRRRERFCGLKEKRG